MLAAIAVTLTAHAQPEPSAAIPAMGGKPAAAPPTEAAIANWRAKRYGMFIHWGPVSLTGKEIDVVVMLALDKAAMDIAPIDVKEPCGFRYHFVTASCLTSESVRAREKTANSSM